MGFTGIQITIGMKRALKQYWIEAKMVQFEEMKKGSAKFDIWVLGNNKRDGGCGE